MNETYICCNTVYGILKDKAFQSIDFHCFNFLQTFKSLQREEKFHQGYGEK